MIQGDGEDNYCKRRNFSSDTDFKFNYYIPRKEKEKENSEICENNMKNYSDIYREKNNIERNSDSNQEKKENIIKDTFTHNSQSNFYGRDSNKNVLKDSAGENRFSKEIKNERVFGKLLVNLKVS